MAKRDEKQEEEDERNESQQKRLVLAVLFLILNMAIASQYAVTKIG